MRVLVPRRLGKHQNNGSRPLALLHEPAMQHAFDQYLFRFISCPRISKRKMSFKLQIRWMTSEAGGRFIN